MTDPADLVNTILAATPLPPGADPQVVVGYEVEPFGHGAVYHELTGPARPVAARQAAAALRWLADHAGADIDEHPRWYQADLRELADQLDTQETP